MMPYSPGRPPPPEIEGGGVRVIQLRKLLNRYISTLEVRSSASIILILIYYSG